MNHANPYLKQVSTEGKVEQVIQSLQNYIIEGGLKPGMAIIPERQMAQQFGVSRYCLREALRVAQSQGLIEIQRGCRPRVAALSAEAAVNLMSLNLRRCPSKLLELIEARRYIECGIADLAALRAGPGHIQALRKNIDEMSAHKHDPACCIEKDMEFHGILLEACGNSIFEIVLTPLSELLKQSRVKTMTVDVNRAIVGHKNILKAIIAQDRRKAASAMQQHLEMAAADLKQIQEPDHVQNH